MIRYALIVVTCTCIAACAQTRKPERLEIGDSQRVEATIEAINPTNRQVVLLAPDDSRLLVEVGLDVRNFDQIRAGDRVVVTYRAGVIAEVKPKGEGVQGVEGASADVRSGPGERPSRAVGEVIATTVTIESVDTSFDTVTFRRPDGIVRTLAVEDPEAKEFIHKLKPGDEVQVTYREAAAISIEPPRG